MDIGSLRREYESQGLDREALADDPATQFEKWFREAQEAGVADVNAMSMASVDPSGMPCVRTVLLKAFDEEGFVFFTNYQSHKGHEIAANPRIALLFPWLELNRQVIVQGMAEKVTQDISRRYFNSRPRSSQLSAWASRQSEPVESRRVLEQKLDELSRRYDEEEIPLPPFWGGYRLVPQRVEFWQGRPNRLHDRFEYLQDGGRWLIRRLQP